MAERLTVSLEDGIPDKLRTLAGGERKVGAYLSQLVAWLWEYREALEQEGAGIRDFVPVRMEWIPRVVMSPEEQHQKLEDYDSFRAEMGRLQQKYSELTAHIDALAGSMGVDFYSYTLPTQEDGSQNDTQRHA